MINKIQFDPVDGLKNKNVYPAQPVSEDAARAQLQDLHDQTKDYLDDVVDILNSTTDGTSGADNVACPTLIGGGGLTVKTNLEKVVNEIQNIQVGQIGENAIATSNIQNDAVTLSKIANDSISTLKIQDDAITSDKITDNAITTAMIQDDAVTKDKLQDEYTLFNTNALWNFNRYMYNQYLGSAAGLAGSMSLRGVQWDAIRDTSLISTSSGATVRTRTTTGYGLNYFTYTGHASLNENPFKYLPIISGDRGNNYNSSHPTVLPINATTVPSALSGATYSLSSMESSSLDHTVYYDLGASTYIPTLNLVANLYWNKFYKHTSYPRSFRIYGGNELDTTPVRSPGPMTLLYQRDRDFINGDELNVAINIAVNASYRYIVLDLYGVAEQNYDVLFYSFRDLNASGYTLGANDRNFVTTAVTMPSFNYCSVDLATVATGTYNVYLSNDAGTNYIQATPGAVVNYYVDTNRRERNYTCEFPSAGTSFVMKVQPDNYSVDHVVTSYNLFTTLR